MFTHFFGALPRRSPIHAGFRARGEFQRGAVVGKQAHDAVGKGNAAVSAYVLVAIVKKRLNFDASLYNLLQIFSLTMPAHTASLC